MALSTENVTTLVDEGMLYIILTLYSTVLNVHLTVALTSYNFKELGILQTQCNYEFRAIRTVGIRSEYFPKQHLSVACAKKAWRVLCEV
jgi:hypothetical protein